MSEKEKIIIKQVILLVTFLVIGIGVGLLSSGLLYCIVFEPDASAAVNFRSAQKVTYANTIIGFIFLMAGLIFQLSPKDVFFKKLKEIRS